jgi:hypothetical protein
MSKRTKLDFFQSGPKAKQSRGLYFINLRNQNKENPHVQLVSEKYRSIFVGNKIAGKNTAIDGEIRRLPALIENTECSASGYSFCYRQTFEPIFQI